MTDDSSNNPDSVTLWVPQCGNCKHCIPLAVPKQMPVSIVNGIRIPLIPGSPEIGDLSRMDAFEQRKYRLYDYYNDFLNDSNTGNHLLEPNIHCYPAKLSACRYSSTDDLKFDNDGQKPSTTRKRYKKPDVDYLIVTVRLLLKFEAMLSMGSQHNNDIAVGLKDASGNAKLALVRALPNGRKFQLCFLYVDKKRIQQGV